MAIYNWLSPKQYVIVITTLGWVAFVFSCGAIASREWIYYGGNRSEGLLNGVLDGNFKVERSTWLDAVTGLYIVGIITNWICMFGFHLTWAKKLPYGLHALAQLFMTIAANFELIACSIYTINIVGGYSGSGNEWKTETIKWGFGYAFAWFTTGLCLLNNLTYALFVKYLKEEELNSGGGPS